MPDRLRGPLRGLVLRVGIAEAINCLDECIDLAPIESWGDGSQNCLQNMRIVGNTQLVWDGQQ